MNVRVCGPNLSSKAQMKGDLHVHEADCGDLKWYGPGLTQGGDVPGQQEMLIEDATIYKIVDACYADQIAESDQDTIEDYVSSFWFAPCCSQMEYGEPPAEDTGVVVTPVYEVWVSETNDIGPASKSSFMKLSQDELQEKALWLVNQLSIGQHLHVVAHDENEYS